MTKERLSKLQKWILIEVYNGYFHRILKNEIFKRFWGGYSYKNSVILSRSLKRLYEKDLIDLRKGKRNPYISLTEKGEERALGLNHGILTIRKAT